MVLNIRVESPPPAPRLTGGRSSPRDRIYPHRSVRALPMDRSRVAAGIVFALLVSTLIAIYAVPLMEVHAAAAEALARLAGIPIDSWTMTDVFPGLQPARVPEMPIPSFREVSDVARITAIGLVIVLLVCARVYSLFRNLAYFLVLLLFLSALVNAVFDTFHLPSTVFAQIWLRQEVLIWILLPWVLLLLFVLPQPSLVRGLAWMAFLQVYGFIFSAVRMVFILGVLHYTGLVFMPVLWFALGALCDLIYVLFFYSISVHNASGVLWGARSTWQSHF